VSSLSKYFEAVEATLEWLMVIALSCWILLWRMANCFSWHTKTAWSVATATGSRRAAEPRVAAGSGWRQGQEARAAQGGGSHVHTQAQGAREEKAGDWLVPRARSTSDGAAWLRSGGWERGYGRRPGMILRYTRCLGGWALWSWASWATSRLLVTWPSDFWIILNMVICNNFDENMVI
jgi:hypothetical protein